MKSARNNLVALGSTAVMAVYAAGFLRTKSAADRFASEDADRRPVPTVEYSPAETAALTLAENSASVDHAGTGKAIVSTTPAAIPKKPAPADTPTIPTTDSSAAVNPATTVAQVIARIADSLITPTVPPVAAAIIPDSQRVAPTQAADQSAVKDRGPFKDGRYVGWGTSRHGNIEATVEIRDGHIVTAVISQCLTRYSCSWIASLPPQVISRQSANVDYISGATQSANAFYTAIVEALAQAK